VIQKFLRQNFCGLIFCYTFLPRLNNIINLKTLNAMAKKPAKKAAKKKAAKKKK
jgi:hypothetical protein